MKLSLNWLKDYIDPKLSTDALIERLTMAGLEIEAVESVGGDTVLEIEITPNRPDCLNTLGLAREIGAITGKVVKNPKTKGAKTKALKNLIHIENKKDCSRYISTLINNAQIKDAPLTMKQRIGALGIKTINNAVDITNFVLMEMGQPLHAFDYDKLAGGKVIVRRAQVGETIVTLDGVERKLDPSILVIADDQKPVAIAGIMGGQAAQITAETKNILLESAHFEMGIIRRACRSLGLRSDSSYRFERNVNFEGVLSGANRAVDLLIELTGGKLMGRQEISVPAKKSKAKIKLKLADVETLLGLSITASQAQGWLGKLGFKVTGSAGALTVIPPSHRSDISQDVDVMEEIARMIGFDRLPSQLPIIKTVNIPVDNRPRVIKEKIRQILKARGVDEIITHSMINTKSLVKSHLGDIAGVKIFNPLNQDQEMLRPTILPSFLQVVLTNVNRGQKDLRFFEMGKSYYKAEEKQVLGILLTGRRSHDWRSSKKEGIDFFDLKGILQSIFNSIGINVVYESVKMPVFDPSCGAAIMIDGKLLGVAGKIDRKVLNNWDIKTQEVYFSRIHLDEILAASKATIKYQPISEFPAIIRDVSLALKKEISYRQIEEICFKLGADILRSVQFIEEYLGDKIQPGHKGIVFSCHYQSNTRTLREDEVSVVHERILQALTQDLNATRR